MQAGNPVMGCGQVAGLDQAAAVAVTPDQRHAYVASAGYRRMGSNALVAFARDEGSGALRTVGCISDDGSDGRIATDGACDEGDALLGANGVVVSPDGRFVYVTAGVSSAVSWFERDAETGKLKQAGCVKENPREDHCGYAQGIQGATAITLSPDGEDAYVTSNVSDAVVSFRRDAETGALVKTGCVSANGSDGACIDGVALQGASSVTVAPDGRHVYVTAAEIGSVTTHVRDPETGRLTPSGCLLDAPPAGGRCEDGGGLGGASSVVLDPDGAGAYVAAPSLSAIVRFTRDAATGALRRQGCVENAPAAGDDQVHPPESDDEDRGDDEEDDDFDDSDEDDEERLARNASCAPARAIGYVRRLVLTPDGRTLLAGADHSLATFSRAQDGSLEQTGCAEAYPTYRSCASGPGISTASGFDISADGRNLYVAGRRAGGGLVIFGPAAAIAASSARVDGAGIARVSVACPLTATGGCAGRIALRGRRGAGFRLAAGARRSTAMRVPLAVRRTLRRRGRMAVALVARDARGTTRATVRRVVLRRAAG